MYDCCQVSVQTDRLRTLDITKRTSFISNPLVIFYLSLLIPLIISEWLRSGGMDGLDCYEKWVHPTRRPWSDADSFLESSFTHCMMSRYN